MTQYISQERVWITMPTQIPASVVYPTVYTMYNEYGIHKKMLECIECMENATFVNYTSHSYVFTYHYLTIHLVIGEQDDMKTVTMYTEYDVKQKYGNTVDYLVNEQVQEMYKNVCSIFCNHL